MFNNQKATVLFKQNYNAGASTIVNQGGSHSGKTFAILQVLFCRACETGKQVITVVGQDVPNLQAGALRDALSIYNSPGMLQLKTSIFLTRSTVNYMIWATAPAPVATMAKA